MHMKCLNPIVFSYNNEEAKFQSKINLNVLREEVKVQSSTNQNLLREEPQRFYEQHEVELMHK